MADTTPGIITNPEDTNQTVQNENMQDLEINLDVNEQKENENQKEIASDAEVIPELDLDLDLNLPEAPKNDDRLKQEDENNKEIETTIEPITETIEPIIEENIPVIEEDIIPVIEEDIIPVIEENIPVIEEENVPVIEENIPVIEENIPVIEEENVPVIEENIPVIEEENIPVIEEDIIPVIEENIPVIEEDIIPVIEEENIPVIEETVPVIDELESMVEISPSKEKENTTPPTTTIETEINTPTPENNLEKDMDMISELEWNSNAGGLAPEANISVQSATPQSQEAKTFNLDDMLNMPTPQPTTATQPEAITQTATYIETPQVEVTPVAVAAPIQTPPEALAPMQTQTVDSPTIVSAMPITTPVPAAIPSKNTGVKVLLFVVLFWALAFTTFFILKTMYPIEFSQMFGGNNNQDIVQDMTGIELTGEIIEEEMLSGDSDIGDTGTGSHESAGDENPFGELNDLSNTETTEALPEKTDVSKLTDYVNEGNDFLTQGKTMGNNTVIKYGLYVSKKATSLLEKIANGEQIDNITGYFAQFDQYLTQLKWLIGESSSLSASNDLENSTNTENIKQFTGE